MVAAGAAVTVAPVVADNPVAGLHEYVLAPEAVSETDPSGNIDGAAGDTAIAGNGLTVMVTVSENAEPTASEALLLKYVVAVKLPGAYPTDTAPEISVNVTLSALLCHW